MKKILAFVLVLVMGASLIACGTGETKCEHCGKVTEDGQMILDDFVCWECLTPAE